MDEVHQPGQPGHRDHFGNAEPQQSCGHIRVGYKRLDIGDGRGDLFGIAAQFPPFGCQSNFALRAVEKNDAQAFFQLLDSRGDGGCRGVQLFGGGRETAMLDNGEKCFELADIQARPHYSKAQSPQRHSISVQAPEQVGTDLCIAASVPNKNTARTVRIFQT
nr:hypothetical protein [Afipia felis]